MARTRIPKYCRHKGTGQAYVTIPGEGGAKGRAVYLGLHGTAESEAKYRETIAAWLAGKGVDPPLAEIVAPPVPRAVSIADVADGFLGWAGGYYRKRGEPTSQLGIVNAAVKALKDFAGETPATEFNARALKRLRERILGTGLTRAGINRRVAVVRQCLAWAVEEEMIPPEVWHSTLAVKSLKRHRTSAPEPERIAPVPAADMEATIPHLPRPVAAMVRLQLLTGMRPGEATQIRRSDVDEKADPWVYRPDRHKAEHHGRGREIPLGPKAQALLREWFTANPDAPLFSPRAAIAAMRAARRAARKTPVRAKELERTKNATKRQGSESYDRNAYARAIARACKKAGVEHWHPNQLRHTFATEVRKRFGLDKAQVALGHAKADVTQVYAERDLAAASEVAKEIG